MRRATTPTHTFEIPFGTGEIADLLIVYAQRKKPVVEKRKDDCVLEGFDIKVKLSQEETLRFDGGVVEIQLRILANNGEAFASDIMTVNIGDVLSDEELK